MKILDVITDKLSKSLNPDNVFVFEGKHLQAIAFLQGENNENIQEVKNIVRENGFKYDYRYDCYLKSPQHQHETLNGGYRAEKDSFLDKIIKWKITKK